MTEPDWKALLAQLNALAEAIQTKASARYQRERWHPLRASILMGLFLKAMSTAGAIRTLLDAGYSNEAHLLLRPLLEVMVFLRILERDSDGLLAQRLYYFGLHKFGPKAKTVPWLRPTVERHIGWDFEKDACHRFGKALWKKICAEDKWIPSAHKPGVLLGTGEALAELDMTHASGTIFNFTSYGLHGFDSLDYVEVTGDQTGDFDLRPVRGKWADVAAGLAVQLLLECLAAVDRIFATGNEEALGRVAKVVNDYNASLQHLADSAAAAPPR